MYKVEMLNHLEPSATILKEMNGNLLPLSFKELAAVVQHLNEHEMYYNLSAELSTRIHFIEETYKGV